MSLLVAETPMDSLITYLMVHAEVSRYEKVGFKNMGYVHVRIKESAEAVALEALLLEACKAENGPDLFDGDEHDAVSIGGWMNNPTYNLALMAMGISLGLWMGNVPLPWYESTGLNSEGKSYAELGIHSITARISPEEPEY
jgi:hypothetical protein